MDAITQFIEGQAWFNWATAVIAAASAFAASTPTPKEGSWLSKVYKVVDFLSVNFGKAKDKGDK
jgi:hypothetical protein|tara:strand:- start:190 stop:381 length:192 start_codon:yes stop_codon:yes gene_type:complete